MSDKPADQRAPEPRYQGRELSVLTLQWENIADAKPSSFEMADQWDAFRYCANQLRERLAAAEPREGETQDDWSPGDIIDAKPDGTIVLDDGITTHNARRAKDYLAGKRVADRPAASQGAQCEQEYWNSERPPDPLYERALDIVCKMMIGERREHPSQLAHSWAYTMFSFAMDGLASRALAASQPPQETK